MASWGWAGSLRPKAAASGYPEFTFGTALLHSHGTFQSDQANAPGEGAWEALRGWKVLSAVKRRLVLLRLRNTSVGCPETQNRRSPGHTLT